MSETLTTKEQSRLEALEAVITSSEGALLATAHALRDIKAGKLYRQNYSSFEDYCQKRWGFTRQRGYQLVVFSEEVEMSTTVDTQPPANEREAREMRKERKQAERKPICDAPSKTPPPIVDAEPVHIKTAAEESAELNAQVAEALADAKPKRELSPFEHEVLDALDVDIADCVYLVDAIKNGECTPDMANATALQLSVTVKRLHKLAKALSV